MTAPITAVSLRVACTRLGYSYRTGQRLIATGQFPIPYLRRRGPTAHYRFSTFEIDLYLRESSVADVTPRSKRSSAAVSA